MSGVTWPEWRGQAGGGPSRPRNMIRRVVPAPLLLMIGVAYLACRAVPDDSLPEADPPASHEVETLEELIERLDTCAGRTVMRMDGTAEYLTGSRPPIQTCPHVVYVWSPSMPLSRQGISEITEATTAIGLPLSVVPASALQTPSASANTSLAWARTEALQVGLVSAGATVHFPSIVVFNGDRAEGSAIVGYKRSRGYKEVLQTRLAALAARKMQGPAPIGPPAGTRTLAFSAAEAQTDVRVLWTYPMVPAPGAFFRRVPGTRFITFDQDGKVWIKNLETDELLQGPGYVDFVPTPEGRLFVTPGQGGHGLEFYVASEVLRSARAKVPSQPIFADREMADQYPSVGILEENADGRRTTYRILLVWFAGLALRDYQVHWRADGSADIAPLTPRTAACPGMHLSTPMLSKDAHEIAARDEATGTTKIYQLEADGSCRELFDIGRQTSKVAFSDDGTLIAFSSPDVSAGPGSRSSTYVLNRRDMRTTRIPGSESFGLVIPELVGLDSLLVLVRERPESTAAEFRLMCCVR